MRVFSTVLLVELAVQEVGKLSNKGAVAGIDINLFEEKKERRKKRKKRKKEKEEKKEIGRVCSNQNFSKKFFFFPFIFSSPTD